MIIDTHAHLNDSQLIDNADQIISSMQDDNLCAIFSVSYDLNSIVTNLEIANKYKNVYAILGVHPVDCQVYDSKIEDIITKNASSDKVIAIGEIGLDYYHNPEQKEMQKDVFIKQLQLADKLSLPIVIHNRQATKDTIDILKQNKHLLNNGGVVHCFNESYESYLELKKLGLKISVGGVITFKNAANAITLLERVDLSDVLLETDCPYLTPVPFRGKQINQPKYTNLVCQKLAEIRQMDILEIEKITTKNALDVFKKVKL